MLPARRTLRKSADLCDKPAPPQNCGATAWVLSGSVYLGTVRPLATMNAVHDWRTRLLSALSSNLYLKHNSLKLPPYCPHSPCIFARLPRPGTPPSARPAASRDVCDVPSPCACYSESVAHGQPRLNRSLVPDIGPRFTRTFPTCGAQGGGGASADF